MYWNSLFLWIFFFSFGSNLSNIDLTFRTNISSAGDSFELVFDFGVIQYTARNFCILRSSVSSPWFFLNVPFERINELFCLPVRLWISGRYRDMFYGQWWAEIFKFFTRKHCTIVADQYLCIPKVVKYFVKGFDGVRRCRVSDFLNFRPLRKTIDKDQVIGSVQWSCIIYMHTNSRHVGFGPGLSFNRRGFSC